MVYDRIYDSFEEVVSLYIVNPVKSMEWDNMKLSHEDAMVESNKRETDIAFAIVDKLKEKGFVRLEDKVPESKHYIAHITSHQCLVADEKQYNTLSNDMMDNHVNKLETELQEAVEAKKTAEMDLEREKTTLEEKIALVC